MATEDFVAVKLHRDVVDLLDKTQRLLFQRGIDAINKGRGRSREAELLRAAVTKKGSLSRSDVVALALRKLRDQIEG